MKIETLKKLIAEAQFTDIVNFRNRILEYVNLFESDNEQQRYFAGTPIEDLNEDQKKEYHTWLISSFFNRCT